MLSKKNQLHIGIWTSIISLEILTYLSTWQSKYWTIAAVNWGVILLLFYSCRYFSQQFYLRYDKRRNMKLTIYPEFWYITSSLGLFVCLRLYFDFVLFNPGGETPFWAYTLGLLRFGLSFVIPAALLGISEQRKKTIAILSEKKQNLIDRITETQARLFTLEEKEIHLNSIIEAKEKAITDVTERANAMEFKAEMLARDLEVQETRLQQAITRSTELEKRCAMLEAREQQVSMRNWELMEQQTELETNVTRLTALNEYLERDKKVTDMLYFRLNKHWEARVNHYKKILAFYNINDNEDFLPGLN